MSAQLELFDRYELWEMGATEKCVRGVRREVLHDGKAAALPEARADVPRLPGAGQEGRGQARGRRADHLRRVRADVRSRERAAGALPRMQGG